MTVLRWIDRTVVIAIHDMQLTEHDGCAGSRDGNLLESALAKPENLAAYGNSDAAVLAAVCRYGISRNHPFIDGNKRTALMAGELFFSSMVGGWR